LHQIEEIRVTQSDSVLVRVTCLGKVDYKIKSKAYRGRYGQ